MKKRLLIPTLLALAFLSQNSLAESEPQPKADHAIAILPQLNSPSFAEREKAFADLANQIEKLFQQAAMEVQSELGAGRDWQEVKAAVNERMEQSLFSALRTEAKKHGAEVVSRIQSIEPHRTEFTRRAALLAGLDAPTDFEVELASKGASRSGAAAALS